MVDVGPVATKSHAVVVNNNDLTHRGDGDPPHHSVPSCVYPVILSVG